MYRKRAEKIPFVPKCILVFSGALNLRAPSNLPVRGRQRLRSVTETFFWRTLESIDIFSACFGKVLERIVAAELSGNAWIFLLLTQEAETD